jgi:CBS domain-containing protein
MKVISILKSNKQKLAIAAPENTIAELSTRLSSLNIGAMPVCTASGALIGVISERDVLRAFAKDGAQLAKRFVADLMTRELVTCDQNASMNEAEELMYKRRVRHLPVVDGDRLVGLLSIRDIMAWRLQESRNEVNVLRDAVIAARH